MKIELRAKIITVNKVEEVKKGYQQSFVIEQPETKDEFNRISQHGQIFFVNIWSKEMNARFLEQSNIGEVRDFKLWLRGERFTNDKGKVFYFLKLNLLSIILALFLFSCCTPNRNDARTLWQCDETVWTCNADTCLMSTGTEYVWLTRSEMYQFEDHHQLNMPTRREDCECQPNTEGKSPK